MRDELLSEMLFLSLHHARVEIAARVRGYNQERPHSSLGYETPAAFAAELHKQWPVALCPTGSAPQTIASIALLRNKADRTGVVEGRSVSVRVDLGGRRLITTKKRNKMNT